MKVVSTSKNYIIYTKSAQVPVNMVSVHVNLQV